MKEFIPDRRQLEADIDAAAAQYDLNSFVAVFHGDEMLYRKTFGSFSGRAILDSMSGLLTGLSTVLLCAEGKLSPDCPVMRHVPARELPLSPELTVEHLLRRTSSLPDPLRQYALTELYSDEGFMSCEEDERKRREEKMLLSCRDHVSSIAMAAECPHSEGLGFAPSSLEEALLCRIVASVSGSSPEEFQKKLIFEPLGIETESASDIAHGLHSLSSDGLIRLLAALASGQLLSSEGWELAGQLASSCALPFTRLNGFLCGSSEIAGRSVNIMLSSSFGIGAVIASDVPLPDLYEGGTCRRIDLDIVSCINAMRIFPAHTRMERISPRNLAAALAVETEPEQADFTLPPAADIARSAADRSRSTFVAVEDGAAVGLLSFSVDPSGEQARLETVLVDRRYRRRGFGRIMVRWVMRHLAQQGVRRLLLCVNRRNLPARELYSALGFELCAVYESVFVLGCRL